jgi:site-specific DNA recombinase
MKKLIYARQSLEKKDSLSIEGQIEKCIALCEYNGWDYEVFKDSGFSGKDLNRPGFKSLMKEVKEGNTDLIICYRLDRISRSMSDFSNLIIELEQYNTKFISATENFDTSTPLGRAMVNIIMTFAQLERETVVTRVTDNYYMRTQKGHWGGGPAPYGYKLSRIAGEDGKHYTILEPDEHEAQVVKDIYTWYLVQNMSVRKIIDKLVELNIPSRGNNSGAQVWTSRVVSEILWRPLYAPNDIKIYNYFKSLNANFTNDVSEYDGTKSVNLYGKMSKNSSKHKRSRNVDDQYFIVSPQQALIDSDTWIRVQLHKKEVKYKPPRQGTGMNSVFTGLMKCGVCGYSVSSNGDKRGYKNYICSTRKNRGTLLCSLPAISHLIANEIIFTDMINHFQSDDIAERINQTKEGKLVSVEYLQKKNAIEMKIVKIESEIDNLVTSIAEGNAVVTKYINDKIAALDGNRRILTEELNDLELKEYKNKDIIENMDNIIYMVENMDSILEKGDYDEVKSLCHTLIKTITFHPAKRIEIEYYV